jgi:hypothetical protein
MDGPPLDYRQLEQELESGLTSLGPELRGRGHPPLALVAAVAALVASRENDAARRILRDLLAAR